MIPTKHFFKNVEMLMTEAHIAALQEMLQEPSNQWLQTSLQPIVETDENGLIVMFRPGQKMSMGLVFFFQHLMVEQRLYLIDDFLREQGRIK